MSNPAGSTDLLCWRCGHSLAGLTLPLRRLEECPGCGAQLHVCRLCASFAPRRPKGCREEDAEEVRNKESANFCDFFRPGAGAFDPATQTAERQAREALAGLFGGDRAAPPGPASARGDEPATRTQGADDAHRRAEDLFRKPDSQR